MRNSHSEGAIALKNSGVTIVEADFNDVESLKTAFAGSYGIYAVTNYFESLAKHDAEKAIGIESQQGINMATAAAATDTLQHYIWSTLPNTRRNTNGEIVVPYYESKNVVDEFIRSQPALLSKTTFLWISIYASNIQYPFFQPFTIPGASDATMLFQLQSTPEWVPNTMAGDITVNAGLFVKAILEKPEITLPGKFVHLTTETLTAAELLDTWAQLQGRKSQMLVVPPETLFKIWPGITRMMHLSASYWEYMKEKAFSGEDGILTKDDLEIDGLVGTKEAYKRMLGLA